MKEYYNQTSEEIRMELNGTLEPLTDSQVKARQQKYGMNELTEAKKKTTLQIFLEQFRDFLVIILIGSAVVSVLLGETESAAVILVVITMNAILGTVQTIKAEHSLNSLKELSAPTAKVLRNGMIMEIPGREVTVGDEVHLEAGDFILAGITTKELLNATDMAIKMKQDEVLGKPCPDYVDETVSMKVVRIIQGYINVVNKMVWRKDL